MIRLETALQDICNKLKEYNSGGLPFNVLVDLKYYEGMRLLITPTMGYQFNSVVAVNGQYKEYNSAQFPIEFSKPPINLCEIEPPEANVIFIPEFRSILAFTEEFKAVLGRVVIGESTEIIPKDWVMTLIRLNMYAMQHKISAFKRYYLGENKVKGLSRTEFDFIKDAYIPVYIKTDIEGLLSNPTSVGSFIQRELRKASIFMDKLIIKELGRDRRLDNRVYFGGYKCYKDESHSSTLYYSKEVLMQKGLQDTTAVYNHLIKVIGEMDNKEFNEIYENTEPVEFDEEDVENVYGA